MRQTVTCALLASSFTKMGFAGNTEPQFIIPSVIAVNDLESQGTGVGKAAKSGVEDLDFFIGDAALTDKIRTTYQVFYPVTVNHGLVACAFSSVCAPSPKTTSSSSQNRRSTRRRTANTRPRSCLRRSTCRLVHCRPGRPASWSSRDVTERTLTGTVIDSGDGATHVIPVAEGYVISSSIKHIPLAGRDITQFVQQLMREREKGIPPDQAMDVAKRVKESYSYVCPDLVKEFAKYDQEPAKWIKQYEGFEPIRKTKFTVDVGYERFLGPEIFFNPTGTSCCRTDRPHSRSLQALGRLAHNSSSVFKISLLPFYCLSRIM